MRTVETQTDSIVKAMNSVETQTDSITKAINSVATQTYSIAKAMNSVETQTDKITADEQEQPVTGNHPALVLADLNRLGNTRFDVLRQLSAQDLLNMRRVSKAHREYYAHFLPKLGANNTVQFGEQLSGMLGGTDIDKRDWGLRIVHQWTQIATDGAVKATSLYTNQFTCKRQSNFRLHSMS